MNLSRDTLELIQKTACEAQSAKIVEIPGDGRTAYVQIGDDLREIAVPAKPRGHTVHRLADLIEYAKRADLADRPTETSDNRPVVWHGERGVVLVLDDADRRDRVTFPLTPSKQFLKLAKLEQGERQAFQQPQFIRLLRLDFGVERTLVNLFRKLNWATGQKTGRDVRHGSDRMGNEVMAEVQGIEELPEEIAVEIPLYNEADEGTQYRVDCDVEIDAANQIFYFAPKPGALLSAIAKHQASIRGRLLNELQPDVDPELKDENTPNVPIYYGEP